MPWVKFTSDMDYRLTPQCVRAYKAGMQLLVSQACADSAVAAGKAELIGQSDTGQAEKRTSVDPGRKARRSRASR